MSVRARPVLRGLGPMAALLGLALLAGGLRRRRALGALARRARGVACATRGRAHRDQSPARRRRRLGAGGRGVPLGHGELPGGGVVGAGPRRRR